MKKFDWNKFKGSPERKKWLMSIQNKPTTLAEFMKGMGKLRRFSRAKKKTDIYSPSARRQAYYKLKNKYGFFK